MSKNLKNVATVEVPEKALNRLLEITDGLVRMHLELIRLYEQESYLKKHHKGKGQGLIPGVDRNSVLSMIFPLPPLKEQNRIVDKLDELTGLIEA